MARGRFLIAGSPDVVKPLAEILAGDPEVSLLQVAGPESAPERVVVEMDTDRADALSAALGPRLLIEPDTELRPL